MSESSPVEKALDVVVYAPLGVALFARDTLPTFVGMFVTRGRNEIESRRKTVEQQVTQARTIGRFAVRYGGPEVRRRVEDGVATARAHAETTIASIAIGRDGAGSPPPAPAPAPAPARDEAPAPKPKPKPAPKPKATAPTSSTAPDPATNGHAAPEAHEAPAPPASALPIPDYDGLSASQVVERLDGLAGPDLETVRTYERAHRGRRTILGKIAQLEQ